MGLLALRSKAAVYGSPIASLREDLWSELMAMADTISEPWLIAFEYAGYFNFETEGAHSRIPCYFLLLPRIFPIELRRGT